MTLSCEGTFNFFNHFFSAFDYTSAGSRMIYNSDSDRYPVASIQAYSDLSLPNLIHWFLYSSQSKDSKALCYKSDLYTYRDPTSPAVSAKTINVRSAITTHKLAERQIEPPCCCFSFAVLP